MSSTKRNSQLSAVWCGKPGDKVEIDVCNSRGPQTSDLFKYSHALVQTADSRGFLIYKRLHSKANPIHTAAQKSFDHRLR